MAWQQPGNYAANIGRYYQVVRRHVYPAIRAISGSGFIYDRASRAISRWTGSKSGSGNHKSGRARMYNIRTTKHSTKMAYPRGRYQRKRRMGIRRRGARRRRVYRRRGNARIQRTLRDTRARSELKHFRSQGENTDVYDQEGPAGTGFDGGQRFRLVPQIPVGNQNGQRVANDIQIRSLRFRGVIDSQAQDDYIRYMVLKCKTSTYGATPQNFLAETTSGGTTLWNAPLSSESGSSSYNWRQLYKLLRMGRITMPSTKLTKTVDFNIQFKVGYRPIVKYEDEQTADPIKNQYIIMFWSDKNNGEVPPTLRDIFIETAYYDS